MKTPRATTTLGDLHRATPWLWLNCERRQQLSQLSDLEGDAARFVLCQSAQGHPP
jgi:hypothetical protein